MSQLQKYDVCCSIVPFALRPPVYNAVKQHLLYLLHKSRTCFNLVTNRGIEGTVEIRL